MKVKILTLEKRMELRGMLLSKAKINATSISNKFGVSRQFVYQALNGQRNSATAREIREFAAKKAGINADTFWS